MTNQSQSSDLLAVRKSGAEFTSFVKKSAGQIVLRVALILLCGYFYMSNPEQATFAVLAAGVLLGALAQDLGWFWRASSHWPFIEQVIDWQKVEEFAKEKTSNAD